MTFPSLAETGIVTFVSTFASADVVVVPVLTKTWLWLSLGLNAKLDPLLYKLLDEVIKVEPSTNDPTFFKMLL